MAGIASAGIDQLVEVVDLTSKAAVEAVQALEDAAVTSGHGVINVGDAAFDTAIAEVEKSRAAFIEAIRAAAKAVVAPIDAITN